MHMKRIIILALAAIVQITSGLAAEGYDVRSVKTENGFYEAKAVKDGQRFEFQFGKDLKRGDTPDNN